MLNVRSECVAMRPEKGHTRIIPIIPIMSIVGVMMIVAVPVFPNRNKIPVSILTGMLDAVAENSALTIETVAPGFSRVIRVLSSVCWCRLHTDKDTRIKTHHTTQSLKSGSYLGTVPWELYGVTWLWQIGSAGRPYSRWRICARRVSDLTVNKALLAEPTEPYNRNPFDS